MFYSQLLLSKKGALGTVWLAAHCHKRLKKDQVHQTNISSSVDKILDDGVRVVTHRILAFLLLGVVRIYSKKVEYLFHDCHEVLDKLRGERPAKEKGAGIEVSQRHYYSITLPKRFELDAFDLELLEDQDLVSGNKRLHQQDMLADDHGKSGSSGKSGLRHKEKMPFSGAFTPPRHVFSFQNMNQDILVGPSSKVARRVRFSLEDRLDPIVLDETEIEQLKINMFNEDITTNDMGSNSSVGLSSNSAPCVEILRGTVFSLEDRPDPMVLDDEVEKEQLNHNSTSADNTSLKSCELVKDSELGSAGNQSSHESGSVESLGVLHKCSFSLQDSPSFKLSYEPSGKDHEVGEEHVEHLGSRLNIQEDDFTESVVTAQLMGSKKLKFSEAITPESITAFSLEDHLEPMVLDEVEKEQLNHNSTSADNTSLKSCGLVKDSELGSAGNQSSHESGSVESLGVLHKCSFSLQDSPSFKLSDEPSGKDHEVDEEHVEHLGSRLNIQEDDFTESVVTAQLMGSKKLEFSKVITPESMTAFSLEDRLEPMVLDEVEKEQLNHNGTSTDNTCLKSCGLLKDSELGSAGSDSVVSLGVLHKCSFKLSDEPSGKDHGVDEAHVEHLGNRLNIQEDEFTESVDSPQPKGSKKMKFSEVITPKSMKSQGPKKDSICVLTAESKHPGSPNEAVNVHTPAAKERTKILKRKILYDSDLTVPNKVLKNWLDDPSDLKREKRTVPPTLLQAWRAHKLAHVQESFFEPFIAGECTIPVDLGDAKIAAKVKLVKLAKSQDDVVKSTPPPPPTPSPPPPPIVVAHEEVNVIGSPVELQPQSPIAPGTPVTRLKPSGRPHETGTVIDSPTSSQSVEKSTSSIQAALRQDSELHEETNSYKGSDYQGKDAMFSERTRMMGSFLKKFMGIKKRKKGKEQVLKLSQLLVGKTKGESAKLFYEILVLKTGNMIDVQQENAYHDILLRETKQGSFSD